MHERQTPTNLLDGRPWACWGPPVEVERFTDRVVALIARRSGRPIEQVGEILLHSEDRGRYLLLKPLSITEHAAVYAGIDRLLARDVAVKIHRDKRKHATQRAMFESQALARLDHPNIVRILDMGEHVHHGGEGEHVAWMFSVIELCDADLHAWHGGRPWTEIIQRVLEAAHGLVKLHELGFAHCDVKPMNILIRDGVAKLADFGNASRIGVVSPNLGGTVGFVAPEVFDRGPSSASDVFALAATLWVCLFGELPYPVPKGEQVTRRGAFVVTMQRAVARAIEPPVAVPPGVPASLVRMLEYSLDPDPVIRPSLETFINRLRAVVEREDRRARRRRWTPVVAGVLAVAVGVGFFVGVRYRTGAGEGAVFWTAAAVMNPLARAEAAAQRGDLDAAIGALYRLDVEIEQLSAEESFRAAVAAERIAKVLEQNGHRVDAETVWIFIVHLYEHAGHKQDAERARRTRAKLISSGPSRNK
jgi:hypothetical protein